MDLGAYREWAERWKGHADAIAGLDDIRGDWRRSMLNYEQMPLGFPTFHDTDPWELLPDLVALARERGRWLGVGLKPPREGKEHYGPETTGDERRVAGETPPHGLGNPGRPQRVTGRRDGLSKMADAAWMVTRSDVGRKADAHADRGQSSRYVHVMA